MMAAVSFGRFPRREDAMMDCEDNIPNGKTDKERPDIHSRHCASCFNSHCDMKNGAKRLRTDDCCLMTQCLKCGVRLHSCKLEEHTSDLCPEIQVPCLNSVNGCDLKMKRKLLGVHLASCPASVIFCSVEWNRWPLHYTDRHSPLPFILQNPHGTPEQLDIALALRDQAMLNAAYEAPKRFRKMRNDLTERFPAVPLPVTRPIPEAILRERNENMAAEHHVSLSRDVSVDDVSETQSNMTSEDDYSWSDAPWQRRRNPPGLSRSLCSKLYQASRQTTESLKAALQMITENHGHDHEDDKTSRDIESVIGDAFEEDLMRIVEEDEEMEDPELTENVPSIISEVAFPDGKIVDENGCLMDLCEPKIPPAPPSHVPVALGVNLTVETITRYQTKPKSMLTFVCGQLFRRDEYANHYQHVHSEIHGGLTWIEQRCPLAQYGCPFSLQKLNPLEPKAEIYHSSDLQSFGLRYLESASNQQSPSLPYDPLSSLPDEVLSKILANLDGFALNNVSRTNRRLRSACIRQLQKSGLVTQEWTKGRDGRWSVGFHRWVFSTAFEHVRRWKLSDLRMGDHLRTCPFYRTVRWVLPVHLPMTPPLETPDLVRLAQSARANFEKNPARNEEIIEQICSFTYSGS